MNYILFTTAAFLIFSCQKESSSRKQIDCIEVDYNSLFTVSLEDEVCLPDGSSFIIKNIKDEFCPCDALCKWQGELKVIVETTELTGEKSTVGIGSATYSLRPYILENSFVQSFVYDYELGSLPDCISEFDAQKINLKLTISQ